MTNWEKMLQGMMYNDVADSLFDLRVEANRFSADIIRQMMSKQSYAGRFWNSC